MGFPSKLEPNGKQRSLNTNMGSVEEVNVVVFEGAVPGAPQAEREAFVEAAPASSTALAAGNGGRC